MSEKPERDIHSQTRDAIRMCMSNIDIIREHNWNDNSRDVLLATLSMFIATELGLLSMILRELQETKKEA